MESIKFGEACIEAGVCGLVAAPPYYFRMSQKDLLRHVEYLTTELPRPLFLYNIPGLTKLAWEAETVAEAAQIPGIAGLKDSLSRPHLSSARAAPHSLASRLQRPGGTGRDTRSGDDAGRPRRRFRRSEPPP